MPDSVRYRPLQLLGLALLMTCFSGVAPALTLLGWKDQIASVERGIGILLCLTGIIWVFLSWRKPPRDYTIVAVQTGEKARIGLREWSLVFLPCVPLLVYYALVTYNLEGALFFADQDFTNMSAALNNTVRGRGFLATPFLHTGESTSYLGHHFSPGLIILTPLYGIAAALGLPETNHMVYAVTLGLVVFAGLALWSYYVLIETKSPVLALVIMTIVALSFPMWRILLSYHFEVLVLPCSALFFIGRSLRRRRLILVALVLWLSVKEDIALATLLFGIYVALHRGERRTRWQPVAVIVISLVYLVFAQVAMRQFAGESSINWADYLQPSSDWPQAKPATMAVLFAFAFLPILNLRLFIIGIAPLLALHALSYHPWHAALLGHYSYLILPVMIYGATRGLKRLRGWHDHLLRRDIALAGLSILIGVALLAAARDDITPVEMQEGRAEYEQAAELMGYIPGNACIQTQAIYSPLAPLHAMVFPLKVPEQNAYHDLVPGPHNFADFHFVGELCRDEYYLLIDAKHNRPPYYTAEEVDAFIDYARTNLNEVKTIGDLTLYRLKPYYR